MVIFFPTAPIYEFPKPKCPTFANYHYLPKVSYRSNCLWCELVENHERPWNCLTYSRRRYLLSSKPASATKWRQPAIYMRNVRESVRWLTRGNQSSLIKCVWRLWKARVKRFQLDLGRVHMPPKLEISSAFLSFGFLNAYRNPSLYTSNRIGWNQRSLSTEKAVEQPGVYQHIYSVVAIVWG